MRPACAPAALPQRARSARGEAREGAPPSAPTPGATATSIRTPSGLSLELADAGTLTAIASSSPRTWIDSWMIQLNLRNHFHHITTVDDTGKVKPDPSIFLHAAESLGVEPEEVVIFEDSLNGLRAAQAAGMRCIVAPGPMTRHLDFTGAWKRVESLAHVSLATLS